MTHQTLVSTQDLAEHLNEANWLIADCRFLLSNPDERENDYLQAHIPGAIYIHLDRDLSGPVIPGVTGRHPLPSPNEAAIRLGSLGIGPGIQVVAYDDQGGSLAAARLWFMLRWLGHKDVAVLDGGWQKWLDEDQPLHRGREIRLPRDFAPQVQEGLIVDLQEVERIRLDPSYALLDVRAPERFRGESEPIDPIAGHIPGARNLPYAENLADDGSFRTQSELQDHFGHYLKGIPPEKVVFYCGSGVTAIHSVLAMLHAGMGNARLYPGSWSEWIADRKRPVASGPSPF